MSKKLSDRSEDRPKDIDAVTALNRIADAQELQAILHLQINVPEHIGAKLDEWRDAVLARMAERYKQRKAKQNDQAGAESDSMPTGT